MKFETYKVLTQEQKEEYDFKFKNFHISFNPLALQVSTSLITILVLASALMPGYFYTLAFFIKWSLFYLALNYTADFLIMAIHYIKLKQFCKRCGIKND